jgi:hypothetical protein
LIGSVAVVDELPPAINNHPTANNIMVYTVAQNGTVVSQSFSLHNTPHYKTWQSFTKNVPTGGVGAHVWDYIFFIPDALFSQSSVFRDGNFLYTVNVSLSY